jgi:transcriptional regulator with XRE-family HTH domain
MYSSLILLAFRYRIIVSDIETHLEVFMEIGNRLRELREEKEYSQGDIESRTGLLRCYISRVENGHTVPSIDTLEKLARALEIPMYRLFTTEENVKALSVVKKNPNSAERFGERGKEITYINTLTKSLAKISERDRIVLLKFTATLTRVKNE